MPQRKAPKSWAEQLADLDDPTPRDFDPEENGGTFGNSSDTSSERSDENSESAREHYVDLKESKLRKPHQPSLGPEYIGSQISRDALHGDKSDEDPFRKTTSESGRSDNGSAAEEYDDPDVDMAERSTNEDEELDSDEAFGDGDDERFEGFTFRGSMKAKSKNLNLAYMEEESDAESGSAEERGDAPVEEDVGASEDGNMDDDIASAFERDEDGDLEMSATFYSDSEAASPSNNDGLEFPKAPSSDRALLRRMMADSQATVLSNITTAQKADAAKGKAIKQQRSTFDSLLNTRIKLQKALIATNSLQASPQPSTSTEEDKATIQSAEQAALNLWNTLDSLLTTIHPTTSSNPAPPATPKTPATILQDRTLAHMKNRLPHHRTTLTKWSHKTNPPSLPSRNKFSQTPTQLPLTTVLDQALTGPSAEKLLAKTRVPRSCAPLHAARGLESAEGIYDDADFYTLLLRELVDQRMASNATAPTASNGAPALLPGMKDRSLRVKKKIDTKASKGRKMRYTVHEKLQNFVAPEDRGNWGGRQRMELFAGLLGRKVEMGEGVGSEGSEDEDGDQGRREEEGLMLFRR